MSAPDPELLRALETRFEELEIRLAHLEYALQSQNEELLHLQQTNAMLVHQVRELGDRLRALADRPGSDPAAEPPPPHY